MRLRFLLRPGWLALLVAVLAFAGACFWLLSPWQFGRNAERAAQNDAISAALGRAPEPLSRLLPGDTEPTGRQQWREITVTGRYLPEAETVARLRTVDGEPASEVLTPLRSTSGQVLLIDRGYVTVTEGGLSGYAPAPTGTVRLTARVRPDESSAGTRPTFVAEGRRQVYRINAGAIGQVVGLDIRPGYFTLVGGQPGVLKVLPLPEVDSGPFLSYALQWIAFGVMAIGGLGYFTWRELKPGGALTSDGRAKRRAERTSCDRPTKPVRGRRAVAAMVAEEEATEREHADSA